jgi:hypothetical protein
MSVHLEGSLRLKKNFDGVRVQATGTMTGLDDDALATACIKLGLTLPAVDDDEPRRSVGGMANVNIAALDALTSERCLLKISREHDEAAVVRQAALLLRLHELGFRTVPPRLRGKSASDAVTTINVSGKIVPCWSFKWLDGGQLTEPPSACACARIGQLLATLHTIDPREHAEMQGWPQYAGSADIAHVLSQIVRFVDDCHEARPLRMRNERSLVVYAGQMRAGCSGGCGR